MSSGMQWANFGAQLVVALSVMTFSMYSLLIGRQEGVYLPIITGIIGYFMPSPSSKKRGDSGSAAEAPAPLLPAPAPYYHAGMMPPMLAPTPPQPAGYGQQMPGAPYGLPYTAPQHGGQQSLIESQQLPPQAQLPLAAQQDQISALQAAQVYNQAPETLQAFQGGAAAGALTLSPAALLTSGQNFGHPSSTQAAAFQTATGGAQQQQQQLDWLATQQAVQARQLLQSNGTLSNKQMLASNTPQLSCSKAGAAAAAAAAAAGVGAGVPQVYQYFAKMSTLGLAAAASSPLSNTGSTGSRVLLWGWLKGSAAATAATLLAAASNTVTSKGQKGVLSAAAAAAAGDLAAVDAGFASDTEEEQPLLGKQLANQSPDSEQDQDGDVTTAAEALREGEMRNGSIAQTMDLQATDMHTATTAAASMPAGAVHLSVKDLANDIASLLTAEDLAELVQELTAAAAALPA